MLRIFFFIAMLSSCLVVSGQNFYARGSERERLDNEYASGLFRDKDAYMLVPMDDPTATSAFSVFQYLQGRIPGLLIRNIYGMIPQLSFRYARPALFLDEMRVDASLLNSINLNDVAIIKVFRPPFIGAPGNGMGGAIAVYTRKGDE